MSRKAGFRIGAVVAAVAVVLAVAASAVAAGGTAPTLGAPNHKHVSPGRVRLVLNVPLPAAGHGVFIAINPKRRIVHGHLKACSNPAKGCDFVEPKHKGGHKYVYVAQAFTFSGYWAITPGKYYWQADYFTVGDTNNYYSSIGSFYVK
jgi:hypothetical protein